MGDSTPVWALAGFALGCPRPLGANDQSAASPEPTKCWSLTVPPPTPPPPQRAPPGALPGLSGWSWLERKWPHKLWHQLPAVNLEREVLRGQPDSLPGAEAGSWDPTAVHSPLHLEGRADKCLTPDPLATAEVHPD